MILCIILAEFNFTYFGVKTAEEQSMPLLVVPHGGPHYSFCNQFNMDHAVFALLGIQIITMAVLCIYSDFHRCYNSRFRNFAN